MFKCYNYIYLIFFFCIYSTLFSQQHRFEHYTTKDGLLSDEVYNLHQDKDGYIWIFTSYGPLKYNGKKFNTVLKNLPFEESIIYCIYENEHGQKWIANSNKNIYEVIRDSAFIVKGTESTSKDLKKKIHEIYQLYVDDSLNIYLKTGDYLRTKCLKTKNYQSINLNNQIGKKDSCLEHVIAFKNYMFPMYNISFKCRDSFSIKHIKFIDQKKEFTISYTGERVAKYYKKFGPDIYFNVFNKMIHIRKNHLFTETLLNDQVINFTKDQNNHLWLACL